MMFMADNGASTASTILIPGIVAVCAVLTLYVLLRQENKKKRTEGDDEKKVRERREQRLDATCDAVLGREANPYLGIRASEGLETIVPRIAKAIGTPDPGDRPLTETVKATTKALADHIAKTDAHGRTS